MLKKFTKRIISFMAAAVMTVTNTVPIATISAFSEEFVTETEAQENELTMQTLEVSPDEEDREKLITLEGMMPEGAEVQAEDVSAEHDGIAAYDITITNGGEEFQPDEENPIKVEIADPVITDSEGLQLWHIKDDGEREQIFDFTAEEGKITFYAEGFSVYEIVEGPTEFEPNAVYATDAAELSVTGTAFYLFYGSSDSPTYIANGVNVNGAFITTTAIGTASPWYFEKKNDTECYIFTYVGKTKKYVYNSEDNKVGLEEVEEGSTPTTSFIISNVNNTDNEAFYIKKSDANKWLQYSGSGKGIRFYTDNNNANNSQIKAIYKSSVVIPDDYYQLNGKSYGLLNFQGGAYGYGLNVKTNNSIEAKQTVTKVNPLSHDGVNFVVGEDITEWTFTSISEDMYYVSAKVNGATKYLKLNENGTALELADIKDGAEWKVIPGTNANEGKIRLVSGKKAVKLNGSSTFMAANDGTGAEFWLNLTEKNNLTPDDFVVYSANKVGVSEKKDNGEFLVTNGSQIIVYTRIWDDDEKKYNFYAIDYDGLLVPCYERGDDIMWVGSKINTLLWDFTEYYYEGTNTPNNYYEFYNRYSGKYIAPQAPDSENPNGQILSDDTIGVNLEGRRDNEYFTKIMAWDDPHYAYAAIKADIATGKIVYCPRNAATGENTDFYFAIMNDPQVNELTKVDTIDNNEYGITMKMIDWGIKSGKTNGNADASEITWDYFGGNTGGTKGLLSTNLDNTTGYPTVAFSTDQTQIGKNFGEAYKDSVTVNHLFIGSTYEATGYFEFDSCQNFATLVKSDNSIGENFTVYKELGTTNAKYKTTLCHGQFLPYNTIKPDEFPTYNKLNLYKATADYNNPSVGLLSEDDPRKNETLYSVGNSPNYYNGMELSASFVQTTDGKDAWNHDIIFEFTGDDDFWLYVDNELVIDLGGIHSALEGKVNFATGQVVVNGTEKTLRQIFEENYRSRYIAEHPDAADVDAAVNAYISERFENGEDIFKDYSSHTMKIFYMERGAGASNLHMRFNLSYVTPGSVTMTKEVTDQYSQSLDDIDYSMIKYPYQIYYKTKGSDDYTLLQTGTDPTSGKNFGVFYLNPKRAAECFVRYKPAKGSKIYSHVFFLYPGKDVSIVFPDDTIEYYIKECAVNEDVYTAPVCNGQEVTKTTDEEYATVIATVSERPNLNLKNRIDTTKLRTLTFTKELYDNSGNKIDDDTATFSFRLYLSDESIVDQEGNQTEELKLAYMHSYFVVSKNNKLMEWDHSIEKFKETTTTFTAVKDVPSNLIYETSINGTISKIPAGCSVMVPNLKRGSLFRVEEREWENPLGYKLIDYNCVTVNKHNEDESTEQKVPSYEVQNRDASTGRVLSLYDPKMVVKNQKGYGLQANKVWSDKDYTTDHGRTYIAVFAKKDASSEELVSDTVRAITKDFSSHRYYFTTLQEGVSSLDDYVIREVELGGPVSVDDDGKVTGYTTITRVGNDGIELNATSNDGSNENFTYIPEYILGTSEKKTKTDNSRTDTVNNIRQGGIAIRLFKWGTAVPLPGGVFTLKKDGTDVGKATYTSDANGLVTVIYTPSQDGTYTLEETVSPKSFIGMPNPITFTINSNGVGDFNNPNETGWVNLLTYDAAGNYKSIIDVYNKQFTLKVLKVDGSDNPLSDAHFELYKGIETTSGTTPLKDYFPMKWKEGNKDVSELVTGNDGVIPHLNQDDLIMPMSYYLHETKAPANYDLMKEDILFSVDSLGQISVSPKYEQYFERKEEQQDTTVNVYYTIKVPNTRAVQDFYFNIEKTILVDKNIHNDDKEQKFVFKVDRFEETETIFSDANIKESFFVTLNCKTDVLGGFSIARSSDNKYAFDPATGKVTIDYVNVSDSYIFPAGVWKGTQSVKVKQKGKYRVSEVLKWSSTDYDFWKGSQKYIPKSNSSVTGTTGYTTAGDPYVIFAVDDTDNVKESCASVSFTNCESEFAYLSSQAYAENTINKPATP